MNVLHVISVIDPKFGGPATALLGLVRAQAQVGLKPSVLTTWNRADGQPDTGPLREAGASFELVGPTRGKLRRHPELASCIDRATGRADIVHIHAVWEEPPHQAALAARRREVPYIVRACGMLTPWSLAQNPWIKKLYLAWRLRRDLEASAAVHYTTSLEREASAAVGLRGPVLVEPNGVDLREIEALPPRGTFRTRFPQVGGRRMITFLGRLHAGKGMEFLIPALRQAGLPDVVLVAVGPDPDGFRARLEQLAAEHGVGAQVVFTGMLRGEDRLAALVDADVFALPSEHENFGVSVVEALACGTPVIVSEGVGIAADVVAAGVGAAVPVGDVERLAAQLRRWIEDDGLRAAAAARARPFVGERYDWNRIARRWAEHYERLINARSG